MDFDLYIAVAVGAFVGMLWPVIVALIKHLSTTLPMVDPSPSPFHVAVTHSHHMNRAFGATGRIAL